MSNADFPEVPAREREFPDGSRGMLMHINFGPLPDDQVERTIEQARRAAIRAEAAANTAKMRSQMREFWAEVRAMDGIWARWFRFVESVFGYEYVEERRERQINEVLRRRAEVAETR